jgi:hypothetical protein
MWMAFFSAMQWPLWWWPGFLVLPFVLAMLYGAVAREWSRWVVAGVLAALVGFLGSQSEAGEMRTTLTLLSLAVAAALFGVAQERGGFVRLWRRAGPASRGGAAGGGGEPAGKAVAVDGELRR